MGKPEKADKQKCQVEISEHRNPSLQFCWIAKIARANFEGETSARNQNVISRKKEKEIKNMTRKSKRTFLSLILSTMLIVAMAFSMTACSDEKENPTADMQVDEQKDINLSVGDDEQKDADVLPEDDVKSEVAVVGEGATVFSFVVVDANGNEKTYEIHTDKTTVGDALLELDLIAGDTAEYGLYVKTVDSITVDYDTDGKYWAFYIDGEYAMSGVDTTDVTDGATYALKVEK